MDAKGAHSVSSGAQGPRRCSVANCKSKETFKTPGHLARHMRNVHLQPLICAHPRCKHQKPFGRQSDLDRHVRSKHQAERTYICPVNDCPSHLNGFPRRDKLEKHLRGRHAVPRCQYSHCSATVVDEDRPSHFTSIHGPYECAVGSCASAPVSRFTNERLRNHLRNHHKSTSDPVETVMCRVEGRADMTAHDFHVAHLSAWADCSTCSSRGGPATNADDNNANDPRTH